MASTTEIGDSTSGINGCPCPEMWAFSTVGGVAYATGTDGRMQGKCIARGRPKRCRIVRLTRQIGEFVVAEDAQL